jgi:hypothetical protein
LLDANADRADLELRLIRLTLRSLRSRASVCRQQRLMTQSGPAQ